MDELLAHPGMSPGCHLLVDAQSVTGAPSATELREIARDLKPLIGRGLGSMAIVTKPGFVYGVARMFAVLAELVNFHVSVFTDLEKAQQWLSSRGTDGKSDGSPAS